MNVHPARLGALLAFLGVALGAFGTHALRDLVTPERLGTFETAVRYQMFHALGLLALGALPPKAWRAMWPLFLGSLLFSGSLYLLVATNLSWLGAVAPVGGALQLVGWGVLFFSLSAAAATTKAVRAPGARRGGLRRDESS